MKNSQGHEKVLLYDLLAPLACVFATAFYDNKDIFASKYTMTDTDSSHQGAIQPGTLSHTHPSASSSRYSHTILFITDPASISSVVHG